MSEVFLKYFSCGFSNFRYRKYLILCRNDNDNDNDGLTKKEEAVQGQ